MNISGGVESERDEVLTREVETDRLIVPETRHAKAKQPERERGEQNKEKPDAGRGFQAHGGLFVRLDTEHDLLCQWFEKSAQFLNRHRLDHFG